MAGHSPASAKCAGMFLGLIDPSSACCRRVFREVLREAGVTVFERHRLQPKNGVKKSGARITEIEMENGAAFSAKVFDSSYEGDLMAQAGVTYSFGPEANSQYNETLAGVRDRTPLHQFLVNVSAYNSQRYLLPEVSNEKPGLAGSSDKKVQACNFQAVPFRCGREPGSVSEARRSRCEAL